MFFSEENHWEACIFNQCQVLVTPDKNDGNLATYIQLLTDKCVFRKVSFFYMDIMYVHTDQSVYICISQLYSHLL